MRFFIFLAFFLSSKVFFAQSPADAALCFYQWYLQAIKSRNPQAHTAIVKKGPAGETLLNYEQYLHNLDSIACVSDSFKRAEVIRFQSCQDFFKDIPYAVYYDQIDNDAYTYNAPCPFFTQFYWVSDIQYWESVRALDTKVEGKTAQVWLELKMGSHQQKREVWLELESDKWKIVKII